LAIVDATIVLQKVLCAHLLLDLLSHEKDNTRNDVVPNHNSSLGVVHVASELHGTWVDDAAFDVSFALKRYEVSGIDATAVWLGPCTHVNLYRAAALHS
jgi:hypothetical protein